MSNMQPNQPGREGLPFFARYLEEQVCQELSESESANIRGGYTGGKITTFKYPSDQEDLEGGGGTIVTLRYPSDNEDLEGGGGLMTRKYPSDHEDIDVFPCR